MNKEQRAEYLHTIGSRIRKLRLEKEMTQDELAIKSGYTSRAAINKIELGINDAPQSKIKAIADALNVPISKMLCADEDTPSPSKEALLDLIAKEYGADTKKALELYVQLDAEDRSEIRGAMKFAFRADKYKIKEGLKIG